MIFSVVQVHEKIRKVYLYDDVKKRFTKEYPITGNTLSALLKLHHRKKDIFRKAYICFGMNRFSFVRDVTLFANILGLLHLGSFTQVRTEENLDKNTLLDILRLHIPNWQNVVSPIYVQEPNITKRKK